MKYLQTVLIGALALSWSASGIGATSTAPQIKLDSGVIEGTVEGDVAVFRGIPYAAPPVGALRWRAPQPVAHWNDVRKTTAFGAACPQPHLFNDAWARVGTPSEDCLFLNVWRPQTGTHGTATTGLPVMVFFHGGAFSLGSSGVPLYDGANLARRGVVLVTLNYRLGRLGFFAHPALTASEPKELQGNYGLMDMLEALKWVHRNIRAFGGDPRNVTIFGESAGAGAVQLMMTSPEVSADLFAKAISESGAGGEPLPLMREGATSVEAAGQKWSDSLGIKPDDLQALRALPADKVAVAAGFPMIDGRLVRRAPGDSFKRGETKKVPFLVGSNSFEESLTGYSDDYAKGILGDAYPALLADYERDATAAPGPAANLRGEVDAVEPSRSLADQMAARGVAAYAYYFTQLPQSQRTTLPGAPHGGEVAYLFGNQPAEDQWDDQDRRISKLLGDYWVQFAKTGNPNHPGAPQWSAVTSNAAAYLRFDTDPRTMHPTALEEKTKSLALEGAVRGWAAVK